MSAVDGVPSEMLTEKCLRCKGKGFVIVPSPLPSKFTQTAEAAEIQKRCQVCGGVGKIRLKEMPYEHSKTHTELLKIIKELENSQPIRDLAHYVERIRLLSQRVRYLQTLVRSAFDAGWLRRDYEVTPENYPEGVPRTKQEFVDEMGEGTEELD